MLLYCEERLFGKAGLTAKESAKLLRWRYTSVFSNFFCYRRLSPPVHFLGQILLYYSSTQLKIGCNKGNSKKRPPRSSRPLYIGFFLRKARSCRQALQLFFSKIVSSLGTSRPIGTKVKHSCGTKRNYFNTFNTKKDDEYDPKFIRNVNEVERIQKYLQLHVSKFLMLFEDRAGLCIHIH